ncbi:dihydropteroate synthase [Thalassotalea mangrovi]|uniref:Dihydropteroate synthase n=1 Tax=Thalassotalea mangrovi TaxID=2572245 RepID=A0A4U1B3E2_9GAMM|nr:dihydropteroate synthase [Thalassotalea mangrovi]TKB43840.1 dihydropteroate synthase [Thalassotalea mangrovi]
MTVTQFSINNQILDLTTPKIMGILNVTPDSFSDGGRFTNVDIAVNQAEQMIKDGASILDIGGESTRPGAAEVSLQDELERVVPVIEAIKKRFDILLSIDTSKAGVMFAAVDAGADIINDVRALQNPGCIEVAAKTQLPVCLMHMQGMPRTMQENPQYEDVVNDVKQFFIERVQVCEQAGIKRDNIILDPGYGFGKTLQQNYQLLANQAELLDLGLPLLAGISRKSMIGNLLNRPVDERLPGSLSAAVIAAMNGASIIRVHDVKETADAINVLNATHKEIR